MFQTRRAYTDPDIDINLIKSPLIKEMITQYDSYIKEVGDWEFTMIDGYKRYFLRMLDSYSEFSLDLADYMPEVEDEAEARNWLESESYRRYDEANHTVFLPTLQIIYVCPHHRGKGIQAAALEQLKEIADDVGESFSLFTEPLILSGYGRETNAVECMTKLDQNNYERPPDFNQQLWKQRNRMLKAGLRNIKFNKAQITQPWQSFVYVNKKATAEELLLYKELEVSYYSPLYDTPNQSD